MSIHKNGEVSKNFPLYHSKLIPVYKSPEEKNYTQGKKTKELNFCTNEHPDIFLLDSIKIKGYRNPYLDEVLKVDRNEQFKKMNDIVEQLNLIDYIKRHRKLSQDPQVLRAIRSEFDIQMHKKRQQIIEDRKKKTKETNKYTIKVDDISNYDKIIKKLDNYTPKINYKMKETIDPEENSKNIGKYLTSEENYNKLKQINCEFDPLKSAYITNSNDYKISEANERDKSKEFSHKRKTITNFNLINYKSNKIIPPLCNNEKWGQFYENFYMTLLNNKKGFSQKGGLFTEFTNKNIRVININKKKNKLKFPIKEKLGFNINNNKKEKKYENNVRNASRFFNNFVKRNNSVKYNFVGLNDIKNTFRCTFE